MREAIILAGGEGWRLKPATWVPKPLLQINKKTLIDHQINWLRSHDFENIIVASSRTDLTKEPFAFLSLSPFRVATGLNEDKNRAGYKPEKNPTNNAVKITAPITVGSSKLIISKDLPEISLKVGNANIIKMIAKITDRDVRTNVSPKN